MEKFYGCIFPRFDESVKFFVGKKTVSDLVDTENMDLCFEFNELTIKCFCENPGCN